LEKIMNGNFVHLNFWKKNEFSTPE